LEANLELMSTEYLLAIDQGTTSSKVLVMDTSLNLISEKATPFEQYFPKPGWVEHDLNQIWESVVASIQAATEKLDTKKIIGIGITNQRETICFWDRQSTKPLTRAIVWQDRRTADRCDELKGKSLEPTIQKKTGLLLDPYFSGTKIEWMLKNNSEVAAAQKAGTLCVGTIESFLLAKLTGGAVHATEPSNASRTLLFNIGETKWDVELLKIFGIDAKILPEVKSTFGEFGKTKGLKELPDGIPISGMIGDQQSALLGQAAIEKGQAKCTYGTGAFLLVNTGKEFKLSNTRLLSTIAWTDQKGDTTYALEGSVFMAGATIQWLRDGLQIIKNSAEVEALANSVTNTDGVMMVPAFTGLGAPYWQPNARAIISGLTRGSTKAHVARAALEGIAFQNVDILEAMESDLGHAISSLSVDGGACKNNLLMQMQADFLGCKLRRPVFTETTSLGAIFAAGIGAGVWTDVKGVASAWKLEREFKPEISSLDRATRLHQWRAAVKLA
jgi:glycerol kinase